MKKWLISGRELGKYEMRLEHLAGPESRDVLKEFWGHSKRIRSQFTEIQSGTT